jgi:Chromo (CHRromatin Organisation MOdifier) domain
VSQLKSRVERGLSIEPILPIMAPERGLRLVPEKILARTIIKRKNEPVVQILIKWENIMGEDSTWEDYGEIANKYSDFILKDKNVVMGEGMSGEYKREQQCWQVWDSTGTYQFSCILHFFCCFLFLSVV